MERREEVRLVSSATPRGGLTHKHAHADKAKKPRKGKEKAQQEVDAGRDLFSSLPLDLLLDVRQLPFFVPAPTSRPPPQICHDLSPADLLAISQTSKGVHATLFAKSAAPLWLAARRAVGMPDLETDDMSETRYAFLVMGKACQVRPFLSVLPRRN